MNRQTMLLLVLLLVLSFCIRLPFVGVPLERDEGVRAVVAQGMMQGQLPYRDLYTNKPPGVLFIYALIFSLLGTSVEAIHLGLYAFSLACILALFALTMALTRRRLASFVAALAFSVTSMSPRVYGPAANLEQFMALPIVLAALCLWRGLERSSLRYLVASGLCAGTAMLIKQSGIFTLLFLLGVAAYELLVLRTCTARRFTWMTLAIIGGAAIPLGAALLVLSANGIAGQALHWTLHATAPYISNRPFWAGRFVRVTASVVDENPLVYGLAALGLLSAWKRPSRQHGMVLSWTLYAALSLFSGMRFLQHYFILMLLPVSVASGMGARVLRDFLVRVRAPVRRYGAYGALTATALFFPLWAYRPFLASPRADTTSRLTYRNSFFAETRLAAAYVKEKTQPDDTILVVGNEPEIYFYAQRRSATRHIGFFYLFQRYRDEGEMQRAALEEILRNDPAYIVRFYTSPSLEVAPGADTFLLDRLDELVAVRYAVDGVGTFPGDVSAVRRCEFGDRARLLALAPGERVFMRLFRRVGDR